MAISRTLHLHHIPYCPSQKLPNHQTKTLPSFLNLKPQPISSLSLSSQTNKKTRFTIKATENNDAAEEQSTAGNEGGEEKEMAEIKKAMKEREGSGGGEGGLSLSGVAEEIGEIEWPDFGKVVGTTGVVLGVIAGSSVVLLTVNAVLAELSDRLFAGKGVQDFFG